MGPVSWNAGEGRGWLLTAAGHNGHLPAVAYDFVVLATGSFQSPHIPDLQVRHSLSYDRCRVCEVGLGGGGGDGVVRLKHATREEGSEGE